MKVMVNKNQFFEDLEDLAYSSGMSMGGTWSTMRGNFEEMDITMEELEDFIDKGYGIRINC
jgi:hypothetical protein